MIGASRELIEHEMRMHPCRPLVTRTLNCVCHRAVATACVRCDVVLFVTAQPGLPWCEHAAELAADVPVTEVVRP